MPTKQAASLLPADPRFRKRAAWIRTSRPEQRTPPGDWHTWAYIAGRGSGKTRAAAEDIAWYGTSNPNSRIAVVAETFGDGRDVCIEGESGLLGVLPEEVVSTWNRSLGELVLTNGTRYKIYSGDKPGQLRGPQFHRAWTDELAKFPYARETWTQLQLGLRLGDDPRSVVTTTPRPLSLIRELMDRKSTYLTRGSTYDNAANLSDSFLEEIRAQYEGTRVGRQEIHGEYLDEFPGSLWTRKMVEDAYVKEAPDMVRVVTSIDPAVTSDPETSDETGIVIAAKGVDGNAYVLADLTCRLSPDGWARRAVNAYHEFSCDRIIAEVNNGGDLVASVIHTIDPRVAYKKVHASRGKRVRAEPIAALYEQQRVFHAKPFPELEDQMVSFVPDNMDGSPDRVDALVWALTELMLHGTQEVYSF